MLLFDFITYISDTFSIFFEFFYLVNPNTNTKLAANTKFYWHTDLRIMSENISSSLNQDWGDKVILVVEDVDTNKIFFDAALRKTSAKILWAKDGQEAIDMFKNNEIDLVLMDLQLPILDGYTATKEIKKINQEVPIIAQTAHVMSGEREKCLEAGCDDYLAKPIRLQILMETLSKYLNA